MTEFKKMATELVNSIDWFEAADDGTGAEAIEELLLIVEQKTYIKANQKFISACKQFAEKANADGEQQAAHAALAIAMVFEMLSVVHGSNTLSS